MSPEEEAQAERETMFVMWKEHFFNALSGTAAVDLNVRGAGYIVTSAEMIADAAVALARRRWDVIYAAKAKKTP